MTFGMKTRQTCKLTQNDLVLPPKLLSMNFWIDLWFLTQRRVNKTSSQNFMTASDMKITEAVKVES